MFDVQIHSTSLFSNFYIVHQKNVPKVRGNLMGVQADIVAACTLEALRAAPDAFLPEVG